MKNLKTILLMLSFACAIGSANAQLSFAAGLSYGTEEIAELGLHARASYGFTEQWHGAAKLNYFFSDDPFNWFDINLDAHWMILQTGNLNVYPLAGLNIAIISCDNCGLVDDSNTEVGLNLGGGIVLPITEKLKGIGEFKFVLGDADQVVFTVGLGFDL
jgi:hypothetical protein